MPTTHNQLLHYELLRSHPGNECLVMIHGAGGSTDTWRPQREALNKHFNLLLVDLPGHGQTGTLPDEPDKYTISLIAETVWEVVEHLKLGPVCLVGTSLGSIICLEMRVQRPELVSSVILAGPIVRLNTKLRILASLSVTLTNLLGYRTFFRLGAHIVLPRRNHKRSRDVFVRESTALNRAAFHKWIKMVANMGENLENLFKAGSSIPYLLISGSQDHLFLSPAKEYVEHHKNAQLAILPNCGHVVTIERARKFNKLCIDFLLAIGAQQAKK